APSNEILPGSIKCTLWAEQVLHCSAKLDQDCTKIHGPEQGILFTLLITHNETKLGEERATTSEYNPVGEVEFSRVLLEVNYTVEASPVPLGNMVRNLLKGESKASTTIKFTDVSSNSGAVVGGIISALLIVGSLIIVIMFIRKRKQTQIPPVAQENSPGN
ncbi:unnamed protein product, partial [Meganyctiphanes norvegica]